MIKIGIVGHRNLDKNKLHQYKIAIFNQLEKIKLRDKSIVVYSSLADGADRLVVDEAIKENIEFIAVLPMEKEKYYLDFSNDSKKEFDAILKRATDVIVMPEHNKCRELQYELAGRYISDNSDILFALWDGKYNNLQGGTSETVKYHLNNNRSLWHLKVDRDLN